MQRYVQYSVSNQFPSTQTQCCSDGLQHCSHWPAPLSIVTCQPLVSSVHYQHWRRVWTPHLQGVVSVPDPGRLTQLCTIRFLWNLTIYWRSEGFMIASGSGKQDYYYWRSQFPTISDRKIKKIFFINFPSKTYLKEKGHHADRCLFKVAFYLVDIIFWSWIVKGKLL